MMNKFLLFALIRSTQALEDASSSLNSADFNINDKLRELAINAADAHRKQLQSLSNDQLQTIQAQFAKRMNFTEDRIQHLLSDQQITSMLEECKAFAESARKRFQMEASTGKTKNVRQSNHGRVLKQIAKEKQTLKHAGVVKSNRYITDSMLKVVLVEAVYYAANYGIASGGRASITKGALIFALFWMVTTVVYIDAGFEPVEAAYMTMQMPTTIGYGDMGLGFGGQDNIRPLQLWSIIHMTASAFLVSQGVQTLFDTQVMDWWDSTVCRSKCSTMQKRQAIVSSLLLYGATIGYGAYFYGKWESCTCSYGSSAIEGCRDDDCENTGGYIMTPIDALYMMVITAGSVGYGDFSPKSWLGRLVAIPFMMWSLALHDHTANYIDSGTKALFGIPNDFKLLPGMSST